MGCQHYCWYISALKMMSQNNSQVYNYNTIDNLLGDIIGDGVSSIASYGVDNTIGESVN